MPEKTILYIDDDEDDREFLSAAFQKQKPPAKLVQCSNGIEALQYLDLAKMDKEPLPCLIILDINMPFMNGRETYDHLKTDPLLKQVPVVIFTTSMNPNDKAYFNQFGVDLISKPNNISHLDKIAKNLLGYCS